MADTKAYKIVESICLNNYFEKENLEKINLTRQQQKEIFGRMELDIVGYSNTAKILYLGEITASGYFGRNGEKHHIGANRKLSESFVKLYLCKLKESEIKENLSAYKIDLIKYVFAVPKGALFLEGLTYHKELFKYSFLELKEIEIEEEMIKELEKAYRIARREIKG